MTDAWEWQWPCADCTERDPNERPEMCTQCQAAKERDELRMPRIGPGAPEGSTFTEQEHECVFPEEREPSGRLILAPCMVCGYTAMDALEQLQKEIGDTDRCSSCEHSISEFHRPEGCWFTVAQGTPGKDAVCACSRPAPNPGGSDV